MHRIRAFQSRGVLFHHASLQSSRSLVPSDGLIIQRRFLRFINFFFSLENFHLGKKEKWIVRATNFREFIRAKRYFDHQGRAPRVFRELPNPVTAITRTCSAACTLHVSPRVGTGSRERTGGMGLDPRIHSAVRRDRVIGVLPDVTVSNCVPRRHFANGERRNDRCNAISRPKSVSNYWRKRLLQFEPKQLMGEVDSATCNFLLINPALTLRTLLLGEGVSQNLYDLSPESRARCVGTYKLNNEWKKMNFIFWISDSFSFSQSYKSVSPKER